MSGQQWAVVIVIALWMVTLVVAASTVSKLRAQLVTREDEDYFRIQRVATIATDVIGNVEMLVAAMQELLNLHQAHGVYKPCGHDHLPDEIDVLDVWEIGLVCEAGLQYWICTECCLDHEEEQRPQCISTHHHSTHTNDRCKTIQLLSRSVHV